MADAAKGPNSSGYKVDPDIAFSMKVDVDRGTYIFNGKETKKDDVIPTFKNLVRSPVARQGLSSIICFEINFFDASEEKSRWICGPLDG